LPNFELANHFLAKIVPFHFYSQKCFCLFLFLTFGHRSAAFQCFNWLLFPCPMVNLASELIIYICAHAAGGGKEGGISAVHNKNWHFGHPHIEQW
jgi:hypothetical protein